MAINLVTFAGQTVTPQDDALIYEAALNSSGVIYGCEVTIKSANTLRIATGHGALCGRKFTIEAMDVAVPLTSSGTELGRVYIHMDLSDSDSPISILTEEGASLTDPVQNTDVNINNGIYEINLATFEVDTSTISNLVNVYPLVRMPREIVAAAQSQIGDTSVTISDADIHTTTFIQDVIWEKNTSTPVYYHPEFTLAEGSVTFSFPALTEAVLWSVVIVN